MLTVYKYNVAPEDVSKIYMPANSKILTVQTQNGNPQLWALVDDQEAAVARNFIVAGTGHKIKYSHDEIEYIGTFQLYDGSLVFHLFELVVKQ